MIGWVCSYTPEEIFAALGLKASRLCGDSQSAYPKADLEYLPVNFCPYGRSCLNEGIGREEPPFTGFVLAASCHALVHLANALKAAGVRRKREFFVHLLDIPRPSYGSEAAVQAFAASLRSLAGHLSSFYGVAWDNISFSRTVQAHQRVRRLLRRLYGMRTERPENFRSAGLLDIVRVASTSNKEEYLPVLESVVRALSDGAGLDEQVGDARAAALLAGLRRKGQAGAPRLLIAGAPLPPSYLDLIEELGGNIVGDDLCQGYRYSLPDVQEGDDPFVALARGYLGRVPCPRMLAGRERFAHLLSLAKDAGAQGIVYHALKFCDSTLYEYSLFREYSAEAGMPLLYLETEYRDTGLEQGRTRIQAFLEMLI